MDEVMPAAMHPALLGQSLVKGSGAMEEHNGGNDVGTWCPGLCESQSV